jgi:phosphoribosyl 1,2-cyclic phosphate phosphodiesterase
MKAIILGSGGAAGVPAIASGWGNCDPSNPKNRRTRPSILVETDKTRVLVDTSPDLRQQLLSQDIRSLDGIVYTHAHADHLNGIDDIREVNRVMGRDIPIWGQANVIADIGQRFAYVFEPLAPESKSIYKPLLTPHEITGPFMVGDIPVTPLKQDHGYGDTMGFRFGNLAYTTDLINMPEESFEALAGLDVWIIGCLTNYPNHPTHVSVDQAVQWIERIKPRRAVISHMSGRLDYATLKAELPPYIEPAYDGMIVD